MLKIFLFIVIFQGLITISWSQQCNPAFQCKHGKDKITGVPIYICTLPKTLNSDPI
jgi:hypothetical protein